jgi:hypothetical protein
MEAAVLTAAASAAALAFFLIDALARRAASRGAARRLEAFAGGREAEPPVSSRAFQIRLALPWAPPGREEEAFLLFRLAAAGLGGLLPLAFGIPPLAALAGAAVGFMAAGEMIRSRFDRMVREVEAGLPVFLERMAAMIQITPHILVAVGELAEAMEAGALRSWLESAVARIRQEGEAGWQDVQDEAWQISPSLGLAAFLMRRAHETGGPGYGQALAAAAGRLGRILAARDAARAKADGVMGAVRTMALALAGVLFLFLANPMMRQAVRDPLVQVGYAAAVAAAGYGFFFIRDMVREAI